MSVVHHVGRPARGSKVAIKISTLVFVWILNPTASALEIDGFTEPFRTINVATAETGILTDISVREGEEVEKGQTLAELDKEIHLALLSIAKQNKEARGNLESATAEVALRKTRLEKFTQLRADGHARQEEVDRAVTELAVAEAQLTAAEENLLVKALEYEKIKIQIERRSVRSPVSGTVAKLLKDEGEFVAPNTPEILTIVQLDTLLATFSLPSKPAMKLNVGDPMTVSFVETDKAAPGTIELIAPVTDAESGTIRVQVRIDNSDGEFRSGERVIILLPKKKRRDSKSARRTKPGDDLLFD